MFHYRWLLFSLIVSLCLEPLPVYALRPQLERSGLEAELSAAGMEEIQLAGYGQMVDEVLSRIQILQEKFPGKRLRVGFGGISNAGKKTLAARVARRIEEEGGHPLLLSEQELGFVSRSEREVWREANDPRYLDWMKWFRWDNIRRGLDSVVQSENGLLDLTRLYDLQSRSAEKTRRVQLFPDTVALYNGMALADPERYPPGTFDLLIHMTVSEALSESRLIQRDTDPRLHRDPTSIQSVNRQVYLPAWQAYVQRIAPHRVADLVYDTTEFNHPKRLIYPPLNAGAEDEERADWVRRHIQHRRKRKRQISSGSGTSWASQPIPPDPGPFPWTRLPAPPAPTSQPASKKPPAPKKIFPNGLDPAYWPERVRDSLQKLHERWMTFIPVPGGVAILFLRRSPSLEPEILLDLLLRSFDGVYYPIGRLDLKLDLRSFDAMVKGPASAPFLFSKEAQVYIDARDLARNNATGFNPFISSRKDPWDTSGMQIWYGVIKDLQLEEEEARQALLFAAVAYLRSYYKQVFWFSADNESYANIWLAEFLRGVPESLEEEDDIPAAHLDLLLRQLENQLTIGAFDPTLAGAEQDSESEGRQLHRIRRGPQELEILNSV